MDALTELRARVDRLAKRGEVLHALPRLRWARCTKVNGPAGANDESLAVVIALVLQGEKRSVLGARAFDCPAGHVFITSVKAPVTGQITRATAREPFLGVGLTVQPSLVASLLREAPAERQGSTPLALAASKASDDLLDAFRRYVRLADAPQDIPVLGEAIEREILWRVMQGPHGSALRDIGVADSRLSLLNRAIELLQGRFAEPVRVAELARAAHMSEPTFNRHFRKATSLSPLQFQKLLRLQKARSRLLTEGIDVTSVSFAVGYQSPSQFSREYRRQFGVPPGEDAARQRRGAHRSQGVVPCADAMGSRTPAPPHT
ncbi:AraC family transcriptional regulator [Sorangium sp. So ce134]